MWLIKKFSSVYTAVFLCRDQKKFEKVKAEVEEAEVNEILREDFYNILKNVEKLYTSKRMLLDDEVLDKIGTIMHPDQILKEVGQLREERRKSMLVAASFKKQVSSSKDASSSSNFISVKIKGAPKMNDFSNLIDISANKS